MTRYILFAALVVATSCAKPPAAAPVTQGWIDNLIDQSSATVSRARQAPQRSYSIEWQHDAGSVTTIALRKTSPEAEVAIRNYVHLTEAIPELPDGSFVSYTFSDDGPDLLDYQQIRELHDLCRKNGITFLLHEGG